MPKRHHDLTKAIKETMSKAEIAALAKTYDLAFLHNEQLADRLASTGCVIGREIEVDILARYCYKIHNQARLKKLDAARKRKPK
jgi:hypothetical protein